MIAAVMNTPRHPAADAPIKLLSGTSNEATPFATYNNPEFADANFRPYASPQMAGKRL